MSQMDLRVVAVRPEWLKMSPKTAPGGLWVHGRRGDEVVLWSNKVGGGGSLVVLRWEIDVVILSMTILSEHRG